MNFLRLTIFLDFSKYFRHFLEVKITKRGFIEHRTRAVLTWWRCHLAAYQPALLTSTDPREGLHGAMAEWAKRIGPTGIEGPSIGQRR